MPSHMSAPELPPQCKYGEECKLNRKGKCDGPRPRRLTVLRVSRNVGPHEAAGGVSGERGAGMEGKSKFLATAGNSEQNQVPSHDTGKCPAKQQKSDCIGSTRDHR